MPVDKKIILFIDSLVGGGAQRQLVTLACVLKDRGWNVQVLTYSDSEQLASSLTEKHIPWHVVPKQSKVDFIFVVKLILYFRKEKPDVLISYLNTANLWARVCGRLAGIGKIITSERNIDLDKSKLRVILEKLLYRFSDAIVVNAFAIKDLLVSLGIPENKIDVIYNGLNTSHFKDVGAGPAFRKQLGLSADDFIILLPGRIMKQKNHEGLLDAVAKLATVPEKLKILFVGNEFDLEIKARLETKAQSIKLDGRVIFAGPQQDMPAVYSASDLVVLPSFWEGLPNVMLEAMSCAKPVLVSNVSDNNTILESGKYGFIFELDKENDFQDQLKVCFEMSEDQLGRYGKNARSRVKSLCGLDSFAEKYESLINA